MSSEQLRKKLADLRRELDQATPVDAESRRLMLALAEDLGRLGSQRDEAPPSLHDRLEEGVVEFESEHPELARILRQLADTLGKMGI